MLCQARRISEGVAIADKVIIDAMADAVTASGGTKPSFSTCHRANVSLCSVTQTSAKGFAAVMYNPLPRPVTVQVRLPTTFSSVTVTNSSGNAVTASVVKNTLPSPMVAGTATQTVVFAAELPPMGYSTFFVESQASVDGQDAVSSDAVLQSARRLRADAGQTVTNGIITLTYDGTGRLSSIANSANGMQITGSQEWMWCVLLLDTCACVSCRRAFITDTRPPARCSGAWCAWCL